MRIVHFGRGSCKTPLLVEDSEKRHYSFNQKGLEMLREFAEFRPLIHTKPVEYDDKILSLYPVDSRKSDKFKS